MLHDIRIDTEQIQTFKIQIENLDLINKLIHD